MRYTEFPFGPDEQWELDEYENGMLGVGPEQQPVLERNTEGGVWNGQGVVFPMRPSGPVTQRGLGPGSSLRGDQAEEEITLVSRVLSWAPRRSVRSLQPVRKETVMKGYTLLGAALLLVSCIASGTVLVALGKAPADWLTHTISAIVGGILGLATLGGSNGEKTEKGAGAP